MPGCQDTKIRKKSAEKRNQLILAFIPPTVFGCFTDQNSIYKSIFLGIKKAALFNYRITIELTWSNILF